MITTVTSDELYQRQMKIQSALEGPYMTTYGPGPYVYYAIARELGSDDEIAFGELLVDRDRTQYDSRSGRIFLVTSTSIIQVEYENAIESPDGDPSVDYGRMTVEVHPWSHDNRPVLRWKDRDLRLYKLSAHAETSIGRVQSGAIEVIGDGWSQTLPADGQGVDGDAYFARLMQVFGHRPV